MSIRSQCVLNVVMRGSTRVLIGAHTSGGKRWLGDLSANKAVKRSDNGWNRWTDKQHEEWVDRKFGQLKKWWIRAKEDNTTAGAKKTQ